MGNATLGSVGCAGRGFPVRVLETEVQTTDFADLHGSERAQPRAWPAGELAGVFRSPVTISIRAIRAIRVIRGSGELRLLGLQKSPRAWNAPFRVLRISRSASCIGPGHPEGCVPSPQRRDGSQNHVYRIIGGWRHCGHPASGSWQRKARESAPGLGFRSSDFGFTSDFGPRISALASALLHGSFPGNILNHYRRSCSRSPRRIFGFGFRNSDFGFPAVPGCGLLRL